MVEGPPPPTPLHQTRFVILEGDVRKNRLIDCPVWRVNVLHDSAVYFLLISTVDGVRKDFSLLCKWGGLSL
jgi:hypothetical protein